MQEILTLLPLAFVGVAFGISYGLYGAVKAIGRNPEASDKIQTLTILGFAFMEAVAIYALTIFLIMKFV